MIKNISILVDLRYLLNEENAPTDEPISGISYDQNFLIELQKGCIVGVVCSQDDFGQYSLILILIRAYILFRFEEASRAIIQGVFNV